jgi:exodeoxyribonuclease V alpha subunit
MDQGEPETVVGRVNVLRFKKEGWTVGNLKTDDGRTLPFVGSLLVDVGDRVELTGSWEENPRYGRQLKVKSFRLDQKLSGDGLAQYLAVHPEIKGIGPAKAKLLAQYFGQDFARALSLQTGEMARIAGVPISTIESLAALWKAQGERNEMFCWLASLGLTFSQITAIERKYGAASATVLQKNPYLLSREVNGFGFVRADEIAQKMGTPADSSERIEAASEYVVRSVQNDGHTWVGFGDLLGRISKLTGLFAHREQIEKVVSQLVFEGRLTGTWLTAETWAVSTPKLLEIERELSVVLPMLGRSPNVHQAALQSVRAPSEASCTLQQQAAILGACRSALVVVTGGAGTGKTFTMAALADRYRLAGLKVVLGAPTGKAAARMSEMSGGNFKGATLHRLLGYNGQSFHNGSSRDEVAGPIDADVLLVDETSMIDSELCVELLRGLELGRTAVVFFGDHHQLASIGAGSILRDLIERKLCPVFLLETVMRQAGILKTHSMKVLEGKVEGSSKKSGHLDGEAEWPWLVLKRESEEEICSALQLMFERDLEGKLGLDLAAVQVLSPSYKGAAGVDALNRKLQAIMQKKRFGIEIEPVSEGQRPKLLVGDRVIQTRNNYELEIDCVDGDGEENEANTAPIGVMNGTVGTILDIDGKTMIVEIDGQRVLYDAESARDLKLAYALTIHKSQGSEFDAIVVVLHHAHSFMLSRNLLYTAVTRARKVAILIGDKRGILGAAGKTVIDKRRTMLGLLPREDRRAKRERGSVAEPTPSVDGNS